MGLFLNKSYWEKVQEYVLQWLFHQKQLMIYILVMTNACGIYNNNSL